ncbi:MAG: DNA-3-methyladenine glycosylase I [Acidobacteria bacterium]|nr:DNA-3-methyladenine glycosylase I [Acidobacteriota bacterium]
MKRCSWCGTDPLYVAYHDTEWGFPVTDDVRLFEKLCLEGFQSGLSWITILRKREAFRTAFAGFALEAVAGFSPADVERLLLDAGIVRHRGKIEAAVGNARCALALQKEFGSLAAYFWRYETAAQPGARSTSPESVALSKDLRKRGFRFVGPTTCYAFLQAMGLVNDHISDCAVRPLAEAARRRLATPRPAAT